MKNKLKTFPIKRQYSFGEELTSCIIHGIGIILSIAGLVVLVALSSVYGNTWSIVTSSLFGVSSIIMYTASTVYHAVSYEPVKKSLKKFDHISIYYLIFGSYSPFLLVLLRGVLGWTMFGIILGLAIIGTIFKLRSTNVNGVKIWSIGLYLSMGWLMIMGGKKLFELIPEKSMIFLVIGGICYTIGIIFYLWKSKKYTHPIWHAFVLAGTVMHFFAILYSCVLLK